MTTLAKLLTPPTPTDDDAVGDVASLITFEAPPGFVSNEAMAHFLAVEVPDNGACREVLVGVGGALQQQARGIILGQQQPSIVPGIVHANRWDRADIHQKISIARQLPAQYQAHLRPHTHERLVNICDASHRVWQLLSAFERKCGTHEIGVPVSHESWLLRLSILALREREWGLQPPTRAPSLLYVEYLAAVLDCLALAL